MGIMQERLSDLSRLVAPLLLLGVLPVHATAQAREVVSNELAISQREATLRLEFSDDGTLEIALRDGSVIIDASTERTSLAATSAMK